MGFFGNIIGDVTGAFNSVKNFFGGASGKKKYDEGGNARIFTNVPEYSSGDWRESRGYAFQVYQVPRQGDAVPADGWQEFKLQINPQELQQDEVFAIEVSPTLRGAVVEHHGSILKDIVISGTTGVSPLRREGGANLGSGEPVLQSGHSGFEEFHELRSYFRAYVEAKRLDPREARGELRLVFKNFKDNEFLYVEPTKFTMRRSASRATLYDYTINLKGIGNALHVSKSDPGIFGTLDNILDKGTEYLDFGVKVIAGATGIVTRFERDFYNTVLTPIRLINQAAKNIQVGIDSIFGRPPKEIESLASVLAGGVPVFESAPISPTITRDYIASIRTALESAEANLSDGFGISTTAYNVAVGRTSTLTAAVGREPTFQELQILNAMGAMKKGLLLFLSQQETLFEKNVFETNREILESYATLSLDTPGSVRTVRILGTDDIQSLAARELGNSDKYREIAILNNLKPPYIAAAPTNHISNPDAETDTTGWATYKDAAGIMPVDGSGGSPALSFIRTTGSPIRGGGSFLISKSASNLQGEGVSAIFSIELENRERAHTVEFRYVAAGEFVTGDVGIFIYDVTNAAFIETDVNQIVAGRNDFKAKFQTDDESTSYRLIFHIRSASALAWTLKFDEIKVQRDRDGLGILTPGDNILIPQSTSAAPSGVMKGRGYNISKFLSESEKNLGVDIALTPSGDLAISNTGDLDLVAGIDNITQALAVRLALEKGSLKRHLQIGTDLQIGRKLGQNAVTEIKNQVTTSLSSDPRIDGVPFVQVIQEGGTLTVNMLVKVRQLDEPVPIPIQVNT